MHVRSAGIFVTNRNTLMTSQHVINKNNFQQLYYVDKAINYECHNVLWMFAKDIMGEGSLPGNQLNREIFSWNPDYFI